MVSTAYRRIVIFLQSLVWFQRGLRLLLRSAWLGIAGILAFWVLVKYWYFPAQRQIAYLVIGFIFLFPLLIWYIRWPRREQLLWSFDQRLQLKEQTSTAWSVVQSKSTNVLSYELLADAYVLIKKKIGRIFLLGWYPWHDLVSLLVVLALASLVYDIDFRQFTHIEPISQNPQPLIPLGTDPRAEDIFLAGIPVLPQSPAGQRERPGSGSQTGNSSDQDGGGISEEDVNNLNAAMQELGEKMSQSSVTYDQGQALKSKDLSEAADAVQEIADNMDAYSEPLKEQLSNALNEAAQDLESTELDDLKQDLTNAASQIEQTSGSDTGDEGKTEEMELLAKEALDRVSRDIDNVADQLKSNQQHTEPEMDKNQTGGAGPGAGFASSLRERSGPKPVERIANEGETFTLDSLDEMEGNILLPNPNGSPGTNSGDAASIIASDMTIYQGRDRNTNWITPFTYPWKWRNVVSKYFTK